MQKKAILLIKTSDKLGLVYKISKILYENNLNIETNGEFVDKENNIFFMRTVFIGDFDKQKLLISIKNILGENSSLEINFCEKKNIIVFASSEKEILSDLLVRNSESGFNADIKCVISNSLKLKELVENFGIKFYYISTKDISREKHEEKILEILKKYNFEYIVLAKYMRILSSNFVSKFKMKIVNIHHSFLPAFIGFDPYEQAFNRGVKIIGATSHFVTDNLDEGPIIFQDITRISHNFSIDNMKKTGKYVEKMVLARALDLVFDDKVFVDKNKTIIFD